MALFLSIQIFCAFPAVLQIITADFVDTVGHDIEHKNMTKCNVGSGAAAKQTVAKSHLCKDVPWFIFSL